MNDDLFKNEPIEDEPICLRDQITAVQREIAMRERCYPRWVESGRMKDHLAKMELRRMKAVLATLKLIQVGESYVDDGSDFTERLKTCPPLVIWMEEPGRADLIEAIRAAYPDWAAYPMPPRPQ